MNTVRNCHSPAGMAFWTHDRDLVHLKDCPACKYGTLDLRYDPKTYKPSFYQCADCKARFPYASPPNPGRS